MKLTVKSVKEIIELGGKKTPPNIIKKWYRRISYYFTWFLLKLNFTANQVSVSGMVVGLFAAILYAAGNFYLFIIASILYFYSRIADYCDGNVARYRKNKKLPDEKLRKHGGFFDWMNHIAPPIIFLCLSISFAQGHEHPSLILFVGFISAFFLFFDNGLLKVLKSLQSRSYPSIPRRFGFFFTTYTFLDRRLSKLMAGASDKIFKRRGSKIAKYLRATILSGLLIPFYFLTSSLLDLLLNINATFFVWLFITFTIIIIFILEISIKKKN